MNRTWMLLLSLIAVIASTGAAVPPDACQDLDWQGAAEEVAPDFTPACPALPYGQCGIGICLWDPGPPPIYKAMQTVPVNCDLYDLGYGSCALAPQVLFICGGGDTIWYESCDCACPGGGKIVGHFEKILCE